MSDEIHHRAITVCLERIEKIVNDDFYGCRSEIYNAVMGAIKSSTVELRAENERLRKENLVSEAIGWKKRFCHDCADRHKKNCTCADYESAASKREG